MTLKNSSMPWKQPEKLYKSVYNTDNQRFSKISELVNPAFALLSTSICLTGNQKNDVQRKNEKFSHGYKYAA